MPWLTPPCPSTKNIRLPVANFHQRLQSLSPQLASRLSRRSDSLDPRVHQKHKITGGNFLQSSRHGQVEIAQTRILPAKELMAKVHIRPLRRFPREGDKTIPVLVTFDSAPQCADAERTLRANKVSVAPNYSSEVFGLVKNIRSCIQTKYPDQNILILPVLS